MTVAFYFILRALNTPNLLLSTLSILTSFVAAYLTYARSKYYALAYAATGDKLTDADALWEALQKTVPCAQKIGRAEAYDGGPYIVLE